MYLRFLVPKSPSLIMLGRELKLDEMIIPVHDQEPSELKECSIQEQFKLFAVLRSNLKNGAYLNSLSMAFLQTELRVCQNKRVLEILSLRSRLYVPWVFSKERKNLEYMTKQYLLVEQKALKGVAIHTLDDSTAFRLLFNTTDFDAVSHYEDELCKRGNFDQVFDFLNATITKFGKEVQSKSYATLFCFEFFDSIMAQILIRFFSSLDKGETLILFFDLVEFYSKDTSGKFNEPEFQELSRLIISSLKSLDEEEVRVIVGALSDNELLMKTLVDNYKYCSFGDRQFTGVMFLFVSNYAKFEIAKEIYKEVVEEYQFIFEESLTTDVIPIHHYVWPKTDGELNRTLKKLEMGSTDHKSLLYRTIKYNLNKC